LNPPDSDISIKFNSHPIYQNSTGLLLQGESRKVDGNKQRSAELIVDSSPFEDYFTRNEVLVIILFSKMDLMNSKGVSGIFILNFQLINHII